MKKTNLLIRLYFVLLMLSLAVDVNLFPLKALSAESIPLSLIISMIGSVFPLFFFQDFLYFILENKIIIGTAFLFLCSGLISAFFSPFNMLYGLKWLFNYAGFFIH